MVNYDDKKIYKNPFYKPITIIIFIALFLLLNKFLYKQMPGFINWIFETAAGGAAKKEISYLITLLVLYLIVPLAMALLASEFILVPMLASKIYKVNFTKALVRIVILRLFNLAGIVIGCFLSFIIVKSNVVTFLSSRLLSIFFYIGLSYFFVRYSKDIFDHLFAKIIVVDTME